MSRPWHACSPTHRRSPACCRWNSTRPLRALSRLLVSTIGDQIMHGMQLSVICTEDASELKADQSDANSLLGTDLITAMTAQCSVWPHGQRPADFRKPLTGNVPVLILSGEFDP